MARKLRDGNHLLLSAMEITTISALHLLWKFQKRQNRKRRRVCVHDIVRHRTQLGEFHRLLQEVSLDSGKPAASWMTRRIGDRISVRHRLTYRRSSSAAARLSTGLR